MVARASTETPHVSPRFSILLPTHNRADVLPFAIRSVLWQTEQDFELLIAGDGCTDQTAAVVQSFADRRIRWFDLPKALYFGYANRNVALREARGALVAFMAHDDLWLPDHLELVSQCLAEHEADIAYSRSLWVAPDGQMAPLAYNLNNPETLRALLSREPHISAPAGCYIHRRECLEKWGYWDESLPAGGDIELWSRIIQGGQQRNFAYLPVVTNLHFRAVWKTEATAGPNELRLWRELHHLGDFVPPALKVHVPPDSSEQEALWQAMSANPQHWARQLRTAVDAITERRVSQLDDMLLVLMDTPEKEKTKLPELSAIFRSPSQLALELKRILASSSWKLASALREFHHAIPREGTPLHRLLRRMTDALIRLLKAASPRRTTR